MLFYMHVSNMVFTFMVRMLNTVHTFSVVIVEPITIYMKYVFT